MLRRIFPPCCAFISRQRFWLHLYTSQRQFKITQFGTLFKQKQCEEVMCECLTNVAGLVYLRETLNARSTLFFGKILDKPAFPCARRWPTVLTMIHAVTLQERSWTRISSARVPRGRKSRDRRHRRRNPPRPDPLLLQPATSASERGPRLPTPLKYPDQRGVSATSAACSLVFLRMSLLRRRTCGNCQKHSRIIPISVSITINCRLDLFA